MVEIAIGKLTLKISGTAPAQPKALPALIAQQLSQTALPAVARKLDGMKVSVAARPGEDDDALAGRIAAQILRQLRAIY